MKNMTIDFRFIQLIPTLKVLSLQDIFFKDIANIKPHNDAILDKFHISYSQSFSDKLFS